MLYIVGVGLWDEKDMSVRALEICKKADVIYMERYTSPININKENLEKMVGKEVLELSRNEVEEENVIIKMAKKSKVVFLVPGDPLFATTHKQLLVDAKKENIEVRVVHASSILTGISETGLSMYKFGRVVSLPFPQEGYFPTSPYKNILKNRECGLHTLVLLDIGMTVNQAVEILEKMEEIERKGLIKEDRKIVGCAHVGNNTKIVYGKISDIKKIDFGELPHCIIFPADLEFHEEEFLKMYEV